MSLCFSFGFLPAAIFEAMLCGGGIAVGLASEECFASCRLTLVHLTALLRPASPCTDR